MEIQDPLINLALCAECQNSPIKTVHGIIRNSIHLMYLMLHVSTEREIA